MVIIEFAGPSCSGKSTLIHRLEQEIREDGYVLCTLNARRAASLSDVVRAVGDPRIRKWCLLNPALALGSKARAVLGAIGLVDRIRQREGILLLDEGPVRLFLRRYLRTARGRSLLLSSMPKPDVLVVVTCDPDVRLERVRSANRRHARSLSDEEVLDRGRGDLFALEFAAAHGVPVIKVDTSPGSEQSDTLKLRLRPWFAPALTRGRAKDR